jgi:hypothetical protein
MSETAQHVSRDSQTPFVDEETPFKMKWGTLKTIIISCVVGAVAVAGWAVNVKMTLSSQEKRTERIEVKIESMEKNSQEQTNAMFEQKMKLMLIDQKLDGIARNQTK